MTALSLIVNGRSVAADVQPRLHLADFLRENLRLPSIHLGCEQGVCGACLVLIDGVPMRSCIVPAIACDGQHVTSLEGLDDDEVIAALRAAFKQDHGVQCGFCTPGMLISARDIVERLPEADEARVRVELSGNLCRCTGYIGIVNAVMRVLAERRAVVVTGLETAVAVPAGAPASPEPAAAIVADAAAPGSVRAAAGEVSLPSASGTAAGWTRFTESFRVVVDPRETWEALSDFRLVAACLPGAELTSFDDRSVKGRMKVRIGPMGAAFSGSATVERDDATMTASIRGAGTDTGSGSRTRANAQYRVEADSAAGGALVSLEVDYNLQGPLAQFSRSGLAQEVARQLVAEFARNLNAHIASGAATPAPASTGEASLPAGRLFVSAFWNWVVRSMGRLLGRRRPR